MCVVAMVSGFSTTILEHLVKIEEYNPSLVMLDTLEKYITILQGEVV